MNRNAITLNMNTKPQISASPVSIGVILGAHPRMITKKAIVAIQKKRITLVCVQGSKGMTGNLYHVHPIFWRKLLNHRSRQPMLSVQMKEVAIGTV